MKQTKVSYGNWVPEKMLGGMWGVTGILGVLFFLAIFVMKNIIISMLGGVLFILAFAMVTYMQLCHHAFSFSGGRVMEKIHTYLLSKMKWSGKGKLLDIGCGSGALTIRCAKKYQKADIIGLDFWGKEWSYAKKQCENNAKEEQVEKQITFIQGDASKLPFEDETFDAAISNFVFHEVKSQPNKQLVVKEALRVIKPGGSFVFHDLFEQKNIYNDMQAFIEELKKEGIKEINYVPHTEKQSIVPNFVKAPWMLSGLGLLYGKK